MVPLTDPEVYPAGKLKRTGTRVGGGRVGLGVGVTGIGVIVGVAGTTMAVGLARTKRVGVSCTKVGRAVGVSPELVKLQPARVNPPTNAVMINIILNDFILPPFLRYISENRHYKYTCKMGKKAYEIWDL
jgi:hypothetical protein